jgi:hypothetical protein
MTVIAWRFIMMMRMATIAGVLALLQSMIEHPIRADCMTVIAGTCIAA